MSALYERVRQQAVVVGLEESRNHIRESNRHLAGTPALQNRGTVIDEYLRIAGVPPSTINSPTEQGASDRMWCGMFVYFCYHEGRRRAGGASLPFQGTHLWSGYRLRKWAEKWETLSPQNAGTIIWNLGNSHRGNPANLQVLPGDIFSINDGHVAIAAGNSNQGVFQSVEGNQTEMNQNRDAVVVTTRHVNQCRIIVRI